MKSKKKKVFTKIWSDFSPKIRWRAKFSPMAQCPPLNTPLHAVSGHPVNFDVILRVDSSYSARIPKRSTKGCGWLDPNFITNTKFAINAVVRPVILRFIVQKRIKPFVVKKFTRRNDALITPGCDVVPKYAVFDAPAGSRRHPFDCSMITFHFPIATWFIRTSGN